MSKLNFRPNLEIESCVLYQWRSTYLKYITTTLLICLVDKEDEQWVKDLLEIEDEETLKIEASKLYPRGELVKITVTQDEGDTIDSRVRFVQLLFCPKNVFLSLQENPSTSKSKFNLQPKPHMGNRVLYQWLIERYEQIPSKSVTTWTQYEDRSEEWVKTLLEVEDEEILKIEASNVINQRELLGIKVAQVEDKATGYPIRFIVIAFRK
jgi:hypothetical protein